MKTNLMTAIVVLAAILLVTSCATRDVVSIGKDTYMVNRGGWPAMNGFECEKACYRAANDYCAKKGLVMVSSTPTTIDGEVFSHNASCKLVFVATNSVTSSLGK
jgi:hypothetical protein